MKLYVGLAAAATATAIIGAALAAEGDKFVVRGDATKVTMEQNSINIATAEAIAKACVEEAQGEGPHRHLRPVRRASVTNRMDGPDKTNLDTSFMKARTALNVRAPSKTVMNQVLQGRASELRQYSFGNFANSGGLPIIINGNQLIGAIGVGGSAPRVPVWSDEICAWRALTKVMGPQPPLLPDVQRSSANGPGGGAGGRGNGAPNQ
jgi:uncharacterized protein GlcG (DUF336 family)